MDYRRFFTTKTTILFRNSAHCRTAQLKQKKQKVVEAEGPDWKGRELAGLPVDRDPFDPTTLRQLDDTQLCHLILARGGSRGTLCGRDTGQG